jgi:hypothetical protein
VLPTRLLVPLVSRAVPDATFPRRPDLSVGQSIALATSLGVSNPVVIEPPIAQLRIPTNHLDQDHDADGVASGHELLEGTDPLTYDTDGDGLSDGRELRSGVTNPLDPDTNDDGRLDGR